MTVEFLSSNNLLLCCSITSSDMFECRCPRLRNRLTLFHSFLCHFTMPLNTENRIIGYLLIPVLLFSVNHCTLGHGLFRQSLNGTRNGNLIHMMPILSHCNWNRDRGRHLLFPIVLVPVLVPIPDTASVITT